MSTALDILRYAAEQGIDIVAAGGSLNVDGPESVVTDDWINAVRRRKPEVLYELTRFCGLSPAEVRMLAGADWDEISTDPALLECFAHAVATRRLRERGEIPEHYTQQVICSGCGPVLLWEGAPDRVMACPWCFNRRSGRPIPRP